MGRRTKTAERARRYRERRRQPIGAGIEARIEARIGEVRSLLRPDAPADLVRDYARVGLALDEELARVPRRPRSIQELVGAKARLGEQLQLTPQARRAAGESEPMVPASAVAASFANVMRVQRTRWENLRMEIALFLRAGKEDLGGQHRATFLEAVAGLRATVPDLFDPDEMAATPEDLIDRIAANAAAYLPGPLT